jgi:hypothetical protein
MTGLLDLASLDSSGRVEPDGAEAEHLNSLFRPRPETLEKIRQFEEAFESQLLTAGLCSLTSLLNPSGMRGSFC